MKKTPSASITRENLLKVAGTSGLAALLLPMLSAPGGAEVPLNLVYSDDPSLGFRKTKGGSFSYVILNADAPPAVPTTCTWQLQFKLNGPVAVSGKDEAKISHGQGGDQPPHTVPQSIYVLVCGGGGRAPAVRPRKPSKRK